MMDNPVPFRLQGFTFHRCQKTETVFTRLRWRLHAKTVSNSRKDVRQSNELVAVGISFDDSGPTDHQWHTMATVPDIRFGTAESGANDMPLLGELADFRLPGTAVVAAKNHDRIVCKSTVLKLLEHRTDYMIRLHHEVGVSTKATGSLPLFRRHDRRMRRTQRKKEKERLV